MPFRRTCQTKVMIRRRLGWLLGAVGGRYNQDRQAIMATVGYFVPSAREEWLVKRILVAVEVVIAAFFVLATINYYLLWKPSLQGKCGGQTLGSPAPTPAHIARFRGQVVGKNLWIVQYRWLRRRFNAVGTTLNLVRDLPSTVYQGNVLRNVERAGDVVIDKSGKFDFGDLPRGEYELTVTYPGEDAVDFGFVIDPSASSSDVLIDASPAYYCYCCGWNFEPR